MGCPTFHCNQVMRCPTFHCYQGDEMPFLTLQTIVMECQPPYITRVMGCNTFCNDQCDVFVLPPTVIGVVGYPTDHCNQGDVMPHLHCYQDGMPYLPM